MAPAAAAPFLASALPALSVAARAGPGAAAGPCSAAAAGGRGPEPPYEQQTLQPSDLSAAAPVVGTKAKVCLFEHGLEVFL